MKRFMFIFLVSCVGLISGVSNVVLGVEKPVAQNFVYLYDGTKPDLTGWKDTYENGSPTDAKISLDVPNVPPGVTRAKIVGTSKKLPFGSIYNDVTIDLDKYPFLEISVDKVDNMWYIIILHEDLKYFEEEEETGGKFIRIQGDTSKTGNFTYDVKKLTGLSGIVTFRLKLGVATGVSESNIKDKEMSFKFLRFGSIQEGRAR